MRNIPIKPKISQQLFNNIPNKVINKWELTKPDIDYGIFRFKNQYLFSIYYRVFSKIYEDVVIKFSPFPYLKFEYIYILHKNETDDTGRKIERRYDEEGNIESEYVKTLNKKEECLYIKTKSKDKEVYIPYIWGKDLYPLKNIFEISQYITEIPTQFRWFHKKDNPEDKYIIAHNPGVNPKK